MGHIVKQELCFPAPPSSQEHERISSAGSGSFKESKVPWRSTRFSEARRLCLRNGWEGWESCFLRWGRPRFPRAPPALKEGLTLKWGLGALCSVHITLTFLLILSLNLCFVSEILLGWWRMHGTENLAFCFTSCPAFPLSSHKTLATSASHRHPTASNCCCPQQGTRPRLGGQGAVKSQECKSHTGICRADWAPVRECTCLFPEGAWH